MDRDLVNFLKWDPRTNGGIELSVDAITGVKQMVKISDYGLREKQGLQNSELEQERARHRLAFPDDVQSLLSEYGHIRSLPPRLRIFGADSLSDLGYRPSHLA